MEHISEGPEREAASTGRRARGGTDRPARPELNRAAQLAAAAPELTPEGALGPPLALGLQRSVGNAAVASMVQRRRTEDDEAGASGGRSPVLDVVGRGGGQPLPPALAAEMQSRFDGQDFSDVRLHYGDEAARSARAINAEAYTAGSEIVFGADAAPISTSEGQQVLAHELTHVVQQRSGPVEATAVAGGIALSDPGDRFEQAAEAMAEEVTARSVTAQDVGSEPATAVATPHGGIIAQRAVDEAEVAEDEAEEAVEPSADHLPDQTVSDLPVELAEEGESESEEA